MDYETIQDLTVNYLITLTFLSLLNLYSSHIHRTQQVYRHFRVFAISVPFTWTCPPDINILTLYSKHHQLFTNLWLSFTSGYTEANTIL